MAVLVAASFSATTVSAPAPAASWNGPTIPTRRETAQGPVALASIVDFYYFHQDIASTWFIEGSSDGVTWFVLASLPEAAHVAGSPGKLVTVRTPCPFTRARVLNTGGAPATVFQTFGSMATL